MSHCLFVCVCFHCLSVAALRGGARGGAVRGNSPHIRNNPPVPALACTCATQNTSSGTASTEKQSYRNVYWSLKEGSQRSERGSRTLQLSGCLLLVWKTRLGLRSSSLCVSYLSPVICKTHQNYRLIVALYHELILLYLWTKWFRQCPLIFMFRGLSPGSFPKSLPPQPRYQSLRAESPQTRMSVWTAVWLFLNHNIFVALQRWRTQERALSVCVCLHVCSMKFHPCSRTRGFMV